MLEVDGVVDAYFADEIEVLVVEETPERLERIREVLAEHEIET